jgi:hypothetical protein
MPKTRWLGEAMGCKPGALHRQLCISHDTKIPKELLVTIQRADTGEVIKNPTSVGRRRYKVTTLMQRRVNPVLTARKFRHGKRRRGKVVG